MLQALHFRQVPLNDYDKVRFWQQFLSPEVSVLNQQPIRPIIHIQVIQKSSDVQLIRLEVIN